MINTYSYHIIISHGGNYCYYYKTKNSWVKKDLFKILLLLS